MHFGIDAAIVGLLVNDKSLRASFDNWHITLCFHRAHLDGNRRKIWRERPQKGRQIVAAYKFGMLAGDEKDLPKSLTSEMLPFGDDFVEVEGDAKNRIVARETAVVTVVDAFVGQVKRREEPHRPSKILQRKRAGNLRQLFES